MPVHEAHALGAHVAVGRQDPPGRVASLAARRGEAIHGARALLGASHILASEYWHCSQGHFKVQCGSLF